MLLQLTKVPGANIKTIKMADGVTCGIKVQSQSLYQKVNITNSKLREVKRAIADEVSLFLPDIFIYFASLFRTLRRKKSLKRLDR